MTQGQTTTDSRSSSREPSRRFCGRSGCDTELPEGARRDRKYCSPNCRKRAYEERETRKMAEAVVKKLLDPERVAEAIREYREDKRG